MKKITILFLAFCWSNLAFNQSTATRVYEVLQSKCASCHNHANPAAQLDLEGGGATLSDRQISVYQGLINNTPTDANAAAAGHAYIYPGRTDLSLLFHQINNGLDDYVARYDVSSPHPQLNDNQTLSIEEKELIRQWIVYGAPTEGIVADETVIDHFYNEAGMKSFPEGAPAAPSAEEGFQIKLGPFYLEPGGEEEYFQKYELDLPDDIEVSRMDVRIGTFSHHMIVYNYDRPQDAQSVKPGLRDQQEHDAIGFVATVAESQDIVLPAKTAFFWKKDDVLELNPHYINYSVEQPYQAEVYINVYTSPKGTAAQEMRSTLVPNFAIFIPNDGNEVTFSRPVTFNAELFVWQLGGHTHRYGQDYKIWKRNTNGTKGEMIYDGECPNGIPACNVPYFDYQHIPNRIFDELLPINFSKGVIHEATYVNDGPNSVSWGPTSEDEMMLFAMMFVADTTGLGGNVATTTHDYTDISNELIVAPNPFGETTKVTLPSDFGIAHFRLFDALGREVQQISNISSSEFIIKKGELSKGIYMYQIDNNQGKIGTGKLIIE